MCLHKYKYLRDSMCVCACCRWDDDLASLSLSAGLCRYGNSVECCWGWRHTERGRCQPHCQQGCKHGECVRPDRCKCHPGFSGKACNQDLNECGLKPRPCKHRCMNTLGSYKCYCVDGYTLQADGSCRNAQTCYHANCQYGCEVSKGVVRCTCPSPGLRLGPDKRTCVDIDECASGGRGVCSRHRKCVNTFGSFLCKCHHGFKLTYINGRYVCVDRDTRPFCSVNPTSPKCRCRDGRCSAVPKVTLEPQRPRTTTPISPVTTAPQPVTTTTTTAAATLPVTAKISTTTPVTTTTTPVTTTTTPVTTTPVTTTTTPVTTTTIPVTTTTTPVTTTATPVTTTTTPVTTTPVTRLLPTTCYYNSYYYDNYTCYYNTCYYNNYTCYYDNYTCYYNTCYYDNYTCYYDNYTCYYNTCYYDNYTCVTTTTTPGTNTTTPVTTTTTPVTATPVTTPNTVESAVSTLRVTTISMVTTTLNNRINKDVTQKQRGDVHIPRHPDNNQVWEFDIELGNTGEDDVGDDPEAGVLRCTFDHGACDWLSDREGDLHWETSENPAGGRFLSVPELKAGQRSFRGARLAAHVARSWSRGDLCFSFSHWLTGHHVGVLQLFVRKRGRDQRYSPALWSRTGGHGWRHTQVTLTTHSLDRVLLKVERKHGRHGQIAIDDVTLRRGACR
ncbi:nephronectin-like isoform X2 [Solea senegalensis]|uniref:Nephronectin-like isoform X2 n=1 Tax=Solea senegalensis TaxID=28829 RepID=A0AAV6R036_SOLSE|nr:nephronectin-like isoform X2 [Solea senegalensis]